MAKNKQNDSQENTGLSQAEVQTVLAMAQAQGLEVEEQSSFYKIAKDRKALYVSKSKRALARIDLAGFSIQHPSVVQLSAEEAKAKKLGKVRGQIFPKLGAGDWHGAVAEALTVLNDGNPGIKFQKGTGRGESQDETEAQTMAADRTSADAKAPRRRANRTSRIPVL